MHFTEQVRARMPITQRACRVNKRVRHNKDQLPGLESIHMIQAYCYCISVAYVRSTRQWLLWHPAKQTQNQFRESREKGSRDGRGPTHAQLAEPVSCFDKHLLRLMRWRWSLLALNPTEGLRHATSCYSRMGYLVCAVGVNNSVPHLQVWLRTVATVREEVYVAL